MGCKAGDSIVVVVRADHAAGEDRVCEVTGETSRNRDDRRQYSDAQRHLERGMQSSLRQPVALVGYLERRNDIRRSDDTSLVERAPCEERRLFCRMHARTNGASTRAIPAILAAVVQRIPRPQLAPALLAGILGMSCA